MKRKPIFICADTCESLDIAKASVLKSLFSPQEKECTIVLRNGSVVKVKENQGEVIRGQRAKVIDPYYQDMPLLDKKILDDVISKFLGDERLTKPDVDSDIYLSSRLD